MTVAVVLQPGYLPWLGFFDQIRRSDVFIYYDDVQFDKNGWRNRNRIKSPSGPMWLTVPVLNSGRHGQRIDAVEIDNRRPWARKHVAAIGQNYARAPHVSRYLPQLEELLARRWDRLVELDIAVTGLMCEWLGLQRRFERSSMLGIEGERNARLLALCRRFDADCYLSGDSAMDYLDSGLFAQRGVRVEWQAYRHPSYSQLHGGFVPYLSALDLILNVGPESAGVLEGRS